jgi:hypothetical protein
VRVLGPAVVGARWADQVHLELPAAAHRQARIDVGGVGQTLAREQARVAGHLMDRGRELAFGDRRRRGRHLGDQVGRLAVARV